MQVLIADDSKVTRSILQHTLEQAGYAVVAYEDGLSAWNAISKGNFPLIVLDWVMPGMSGLEVCQKIREQKPNQWIHVVLLTAMDRPDDIITAFRSGASDYVTKPFREEELLARIAVGARINSLQMELAQAHKLESVGQLAAGIAHEINTPTQYVGDNTRFLKDAFKDLRDVLAQYETLFETAKDGPVDEQILADVEAEIQRVDIKYLLEEIPQAIDQTLEGVGRVTKIVSAMKQFSHPGGEEKCIVNLNDAIETTITVARNEWRYVADIVTEFDPELEEITCMPGELNQVLLNLIVNATHAIAESLDSDDEEKGTITINTCRDGPWAEVYIRDTGRGIPLGIQSKIFDPFFTTKEVGKGTGQGLAIARSVVVDKHGGTLSCESNVGQGATFIIRLPIDGRKQSEQSEDHENACTIR